MFRRRSSRPLDSEPDRALEPRVLMLAALDTTIRPMATRGPASRLSEEELRAIYDQAYVDQYDPHAVPRMRRMLPFFELAGHETVADFGCGNGVLLELIGPHVHEYVGVDFSEAFTRAAERRRDARGIQNGSFHCGDIVEFWWSSRHITR